MQPFCSQLLQFPSHPLLDPLLKAKALISLYVLVSIHAWHGFSYLSLVQFLGFFGCKRPVEGPQGFVHAAVPVMIGSFPTVSWGSSLFCHFLGSSHSVPAVCISWQTWCLTMSSVHVVVLKDPLWYGFDFELAPCLLNLPRNGFFLQRPSYPHPFWYVPWKSHNQIGQPGILFPRLSSEGFLDFWLWPWLQSYVSQKFMPWLNTWHRLCCL